MGVFVVYFVFLLFIFCLFFFFFFFFKQKTAYEIGRVTGVQTCALPIWQVPDLVDQLRPDAAVARGPDPDPADLPGWSARAAGPGAWAWPRCSRRLTRRPSPCRAGFRDRKSVV